MRYEYNSPIEVNGLISNTYILAIVVALIFVGIAILISSMIAYQGGKNPIDAKKRRVWFWITGIIAAAAFFCYNYFYVSGTVNPSPIYQDQFFTHTAIATGVTLATFVIIGFVMSKLLKKGKFGTIFPSKQR